jgi:hypothetical protein
MKDSASPPSLAPARLRMQEQQPSPLASRTITELGAAARAVHVCARAAGNG